MLQFPVKNGQFVGERWRWVTYTSERGEAKFEIYTPTSDEWLKLVSRTRVGEGRKSDWPAMRQHIARHWVRNWEGPMDPDRQPLECNEANRNAVFLYDQDCYDWIHEQIKRSADVVEAGNGDSGTD